MFIFLFMDLKNSTIWSKSLLFKKIINIIVTIGYDNGKNICLVWYKNNEMIGFSLFFKVANVLFYLYLRTMSFLTLVILIFF